LADGGNHVSNIMVPRFAECQAFHCKYHGKQDRYSVKFFPKEMLVVVKCIECKPPMEIVRFKVAREDPPTGNDHRVLKPRSYKITSG
jgi:hypothetical protein